MTDNRTIELRVKLDELGIEHFDYDKGGRTQTQWEAPDGERHFTYETSNNQAKTARLVIAWFPTPEQAIAATLGKEKAGKKSPPKGGPGPCGQPSDAIIHDAAALGDGKLTAEQVREAAKSNSRQYESPVDDGVWITEYDWQAIADELNATLGGGECEAIHDKSYYKGIHGYCEGLKCSNCGEPLFSEFKSCPWCGKRIRKKVDE